MKQSSEKLRDRMIPIKITDKIEKKTFSLAKFEKNAEAVRKTFSDEDLLRYR